MTTEPQRDFDADLKLAEAASPGPWEAPGNYTRMVFARSSGTIADVMSEPRGRADTLFIAAAREGWPAALREIERLKALYAAACDRIASQADALSRTAERRDAPSPGGDIHKCRFCESRDCHYLIVSAYDGIPAEDPCHSIRSSASVQA